MKTTYPAWITILGWTWLVLLVGTLTGSWFLGPENHWVLWGGVAWGLAFCALLVWRWRVRGSEPG